MSLNIPDSDYKRVVVVGGGFAGLELIKKLRGDVFETVLLDRNNYHKFQPLLYQLSTAVLDAGDITFPFRKLFRRKKNFHFRMTEVKSVDPDNKQVVTGHGILRYDHLVLASGSTANFFGIKSVEAEAMTMKEMTDSLAIRNRILSNLEDSLLEHSPSEREALLNVVIVGGGASGIELAGALADMKRHILPQDYPEMNVGEFTVYLVEATDKLIGTMSAGTSEGALGLLRKMGIKVILNSPVTDYRDRRVILADGTAILTRNLIWTSGVEVKLPTGLEKGVRSKSGRILTDEYFRVSGYADIFAIGDASLQQTESFPKGYPQLAREAINQAHCLAEYFTDRFGGREVKPYRHVNYPVMVTVGRNRAFADYGKLHIRGFIAWAAWAVIHIAAMLGVKNKISILWSWFWNYITFDNPSRIITGTGKGGQRCEAGK